MIISKNYKGEELFFQSKKINPWIILMKYLKILNLPLSIRVLFFHKTLYNIIFKKIAAFAYSNRVPLLLIFNVLKWHYKSSFTITNIMAIREFYSCWNCQHNGFQVGSQVETFNIICNEKLDLNFNKKLNNDN